jgi:hypothetical protein
MLKFGFSAGQDMLNKQRDRWMPGVSSFWETLRFYFAVNNKYVYSKLRILLYPVMHRQWSRLLADENASVGEQSSSHKWAAPRYDLNSPDLYIPLMAFFTYVLLTGFSKGMTTASFSPDVLVIAVWRCLALQVMESVAIKFGLNLMSVSLPFLDIFAYTGYKYVGLCVNSLSLVVNLRALYYVCALYTAGALGFFVLKSMAAVVPANTSTGPPRHIMLIGFAAVEFLVAYTLSFL